MIFTKRFCLICVLLCVGVAGCTPANFIQRVRSAPPCEVQICMNIGAGLPRCDCKSRPQLQRQIREVWALRLE